MRSSSPASLGTPAQRRCIITSELLRSEPRAGSRLSRYVRFGMLAALVFSNRSASAAAKNLTPAYQAISSQLAISAVPVLLPAALPRAFGNIRSVAVIGAGRGGYYVGFSTVTRCAGALSCASFHVAGYPASARADHAYRHDRIVRLADGARGFYRPADCSGASCTEAQLIFERASAVYELDAKVGRENLPALEGAYRNLRVVH